MYNMFLFPSFYAHVLSAILLLLAAGVFSYHFTLVRGMSAQTLIGLLLLASIAMGVHSLSHLGLEMAYNYNPLGALFAPGKRDS